MTIGIFGGTFNPVHWGHLRTALEIKNVLKLERMLLIPCGMPPHREQPDTDPDTRLAMLKLAITDFPELEIDDRELRRDGPSYTVDTLGSIRKEFPDMPIAACIGTDAFLHLNTWHRWKELFELAHVIVAHRPGWSIEKIKEQLPKELQQEVAKRMTEDLSEITTGDHGKLLDLKVTDIDISSSNIRQRVNNHESISGLVPVGVEGYIKRHHLYLN